MFLNLLKSDHIKPLKGRVHDYQKNSHQKHFTSGHCHAIKALASVVETVVKIPFLCLRQLKRTLVYLGISGRKVIISLAQVPLSLKKMLWPSYQDRFDKRIAIIEETIRKGGPLNTALLGDQELSYEEKKHLMGEVFRKWLHKNPSLESLAKLMNRFTEHEDVKGDVFSEITKQAKDIGEKNTKQLKKIVSFFIEVFQEERKKELSLAYPELIAARSQIKRSGGIVESYSAYLKQLLRHPNALKNPKVEMAVRKMPVSALQREVLSKLEEISIGSLQKMHSAEDVLLSSLYASLEYLDEGKIVQKFDSEVEQRFLQQSMQNVKAKLDALEEGDFFYSELLSYKQELLRKQQLQMQNTRSLLNTVQNHLKNAHAINEQSLNELQKWFHKRIKALQSFILEEDVSTQIHDDLSTLLSPIISLKCFLEKMRRMHCLEELLLNYAI